MATRTHPGNRQRYRRPQTPLPDWVASGPVYRPRRPTTTPLYPVVQHHLETFLDQATLVDPMGFGPPAWVERDLRAYLKCGILAHGFARAKCEDCGHERLVPFSCKSRGVCPSCNTRRMAETAAHLTDHVLPFLPVRQWVLTVPKRLRPFLHNNPRIASGVLRIFVRAIRTTLCRASPGSPRDAGLGAITFLHRFGAALNTHFHYHIVVLDGVFAPVPDQSVQFHHASQLTPAHWLELQHVIQHRVLRYFRTQGLLDEADANGMLNWQGSGGFSIDASVRIEGGDRPGIERLIRYCARPPFALERLHAPAGIRSLASNDSRLVYRLPRPTPDGRTVLRLTPLELLERLSYLIPPPRLHRHRYHGVLAPNASLRASVVAIGRPEAEIGEVEPAGSDSGCPVLGGSLGEDPVRPANPARIRWAILLTRIYGVLPLLCPACGGQMKVLAFLTDPPVVSAILLHLDLPHQPPPLSPARGPPQGEFLLDQTSEFDPTEPVPESEYTFDQSLPEEFED